MFAKAHWKTVNLPPAKKRGPLIFRPLPVASPPPSPAAPVAAPVAALDTATAAPTSAAGTPPPAVATSPADEARPDSGSCTSPDHYGPAGVVKAGRRQGTPRSGATSPLVSPQEAVRGSSQDGSKAGTSEGKNNGTNQGGSSSRGKAASRSRTSARTPGSTVTKGRVGATPARKPSAPAVSSTSSKPKGRGRSRVSAAKPAAASSPTPSRRNPDASKGIVRAGRRAGTPTNKARTEASAGAHKQRAPPQPQAHRADGPPPLEPVATPPTPPMDRSGSLLEETWSALDNDADGVLNYEEVRGSFLRLPLLPVLAVCS